LQPGSLPPDLPRSKSKGEDHCRTTDLGQSRSGLSGTGQIRQRPSVNPGAQSFCDHTLLPRFAHLSLSIAVLTDLATSRQPRGLPPSNGNHTYALSSDHGRRGAAGRRQWPVWGPSTRGSRSSTPGLRSALLWTGGRRALITWGLLRVVSRRGAGGVR